MLYTNDGRSIVGLIDIIDYTDIFIPYEDCSKAPSTHLPCTFFYVSISIIYYIFFLFFFFSFHDDSDDFRMSVQLPPCSGGCHHFSSRDRDVISLRHMLLLLRALTRVSDPIAYLNNE